MQNILVANVDVNHSGDLVFASLPELTAGDIDEAADVLTRVFVPAKVNAIGMTRLELRMNVVQFPVLTAGHVRFGADVDIQVDEVSDYYIDVPLTGQAVNRWRDGWLEKTSVGSAAVFSPGTPCELGWSADCQQVCIKVMQPEMQRQLEAMLNHPAPQPLVFSRRMDMKTAGSSGWFDLVRLLARDAGRSNGLLAHRLALENLQHLLIQGLLLVQPHNYAEALADGDRAGSGAVVKHAIDLMHAQPEIPWNSVELARATGVSARALQKAFQRSGQPPPMTYLRRLRLSRAHADLAGSSAESITVTTIAGRWGFLHLGRFSEQYRQLFGESPSQTLRSRVR
ncbi:MAG TPA: AraC family transcriptional regulator [Mycobacterium sp.]|nr:AraC family transcriptional regulator [Mycobacterium sp.]